jgi:alkylhydroperoxidase family enzyme
VTRLPFIDPETLTPEQQRALEFSAVPMKFIVAHARDTFIPLYQAVGALRASPEFPPKLRQLTMLLAAHQSDCEYIRAQHEPRTLEEGASEEQIAAVREGRPVPGPEGVVLAFLDDLFNGREPDDAQMAEALEVVSVRGLVEAMLQFGLYSMFGRMIEAAGLPIDEPLPRGDFSALDPQ